MAAICSEEARQALDLITPRSQPGVSPVHVLDASWPMQRCAVEAQLSRKRDLTLLEKYTLRAFNEIPGVSAAEIADRLGLKEPELIDETLLALQNAEAIESSIAVDSSEELAEAREELRLLEDKMNANAFHGAVQRNMEKKRDILRQKIAKSESSRGLSLRDRISKVFERLMKFTAKLTARGKKHLAEGTITEPTKKEIFDFSRSLGNGTVMMTKGHGFTPTNLIGAANYWVPLKDVKRYLANPSERDVTDALRAGGELEGELVIQSLTPQNDPNQIEYLDICITLSVSHDDDSARFYVHLRGGGVRLKWIEELVNSNPDLEEAILSKFKDLMPSLKNTTPAQASKAKPLVHINRVLINEIESGLKSLVVLNRPKDLLKLVDGSASLERLLEDRTSVDLDHQRKNWKLESEETPLKFSLPLGGSTLPKGSISTKRGSIHPAIAIVNGQNSNLSIELPVLVYSEELGKLNVSEIESRLKKEIDVKSYFLLTRSQPDFVNWMNEQLTEMKKIEEVASVMEGAIDLAKGTGIDVQRTLLENLFSKRFDLFADMPASCLKLVTILPDCWSFVEPYIQQALLDSSLVEGATGSLSQTWKLHQNGTKELPWEDAAQLEAAYYGHCNLTRFDANRNFEDLINEMAENNGVSTESVFTAIEGLQREGIIDRELKNEASNVRMARNDFSHELGVQADLEFTLRVIAVIRKLDEISLQRTTGLWAASLKKDWNQTMSEVEMMSYLSSVNNIVQHAQDQGYTCLGSVWTGALRQGMPTTFDTLPMDLIVSLNDAPLMDYPPQFNDMIEQIVDNSLDGWLETLQKPKRLEITPNVQKVIDIFTSMEMEDMGPRIVSKFLTGIDEPTTIDDLMEELNNSESLANSINISDLRGRWKSSIKNRAFTCDLVDLAEINSTSLEGLEGELAKELLKVALRHEFPRIDSRDVNTVQSLCNLIETLQAVSEIWSGACSSIDGLLSDLVTRKLRPRGIEKEQLIQVASELEKMMPIIDSESFPKTNTSFENTISAAEKVKKEKEDKT